MTFSLLQSIFLKVHLPHYVKCITIPINDLGRVINEIRTTENVSLAENIHLLDRGFPILYPKFHRMAIYSVDSEKYPAAKYYLPPVGICVQKYLSLSFFSTWRRMWNKGFNWPVFGVRMHKKAPNVSFPKTTFAEFSEKWVNPKVVWLPEIHCN